MYARVRARNSDTPIKQYEYLICNSAYLILKFRLSYFQIIPSYSFLPPSFFVPLQFTNYVRYDNRRVKGFVCHHPYNAFVVSSIAYLASDISCHSPVPVT